MMKHIEYIRMALRSIRDDSLERAKMSFKNMTDEQLDNQFGQSGRTCREILAGYQQDRDRHEAAVYWLETLIDSLTKERDDE